MKTDQPRYAPRLLPLLIAALALLAAGAPAWGAASTYTVNSTADLPDANPGNNTCATSTGVCTLRAAIQESNAHNGADTILIPTAGTYRLTITGAGENNAATGDLDIT